VFALKIIIHCGLDKAGSTAIQAHAMLYRQWLSRHGIYLPSRGLSGFGHVALFRDLGAANWQPLIDELTALDQAAFRCCFLSYEGICQFDEGKLALIRDHLADHEVTLLFYLREQAEILQSGYLQTLKTARTTLSVAHINTGHGVIDPANRDYFLMLEKFRSIFGKDAINVRLYQPELWRDGSVVWDFLDAIGCPPDSSFIPSKSKQNISLDLQSARILNVFDSYGENAGGREALVEDLLWLMQKYPGGGRYFLDEQAVQRIREHYRQSNAALAERYGVEFVYASCCADADDAGTGGGVSYTKELAALARYHRWKGEQLDGPELATLLQYSPGWSQFEPWGVWSVGDRSRIEFRLPLPRFTGWEDTLVLNFRGCYFCDNTSTQTLINGCFLEDANLSEHALRIPLGLLDENRVVRVELRHHAAVSPFNRGTGSDRRALAYGLQSLGYHLASQLRG